MNGIDKIISYISPEKALKRIDARRKIDVINSIGGSGSGYGQHGASYAKKSLIGWISRGMSADEDIVDNIDTLRSRCRDLYMGTSLANGALKAVRTNVIGTGLMLKSHIDAEFLGLTEEQARKWEKNTEREWKLWAETVECDAERRKTFYQLQSLVLLSALMNGDVFVTMPVIKRPENIYDLRIGVIEADRVCNPQVNMPANANILGGVEIGNYGETIAYWVAKYNPNSYPRLDVDLKQEWKRVLAFGKTTGRRNVLHIMADVERPAQRRGVPMLAPVIESLKQLGRYSEAELMAAVVSSMFTVFIKSNSPTSPLGQMFDNGYQVDPDPRSYEMGNGSIIALEDGEEIQIADPKRPNTSFDNFITSMCRQIGSALELPYEVLMKSFTTSYSASRGALLEAWKMFKMRREWIVGNFCDPIYEEWLTEAILKGRIKAPGFFDDPAIRAAWCSAEWSGDAQGQLDPKKEAEAAKIRIEECLTTREREAAELTGMKFEDIISTRAREEKLRRDSGLMVNTTPQTQTGDNENEDDGQDE